MEYTSLNAQESATFPGGHVATLHAQAQLTPVRHADEPRAHPLDARATCMTDDATRQRVCPSNESHCGFEQAGYRQAAVTVSKESQDQA
jgi:hypothetical protein